MDDVLVSIQKANGRKISMRGELLFTHQGLSGPVVLNISRFFDSKDRIFLDFFPDLKEEMLMEQIDAQMDSFPKKTLKSLMKHYPQKTKDTVNRICGT